MPGFERLARNVEETQYSTEFPPTFLVTNPSKRRIYKIPIVIKATLVV